MKSLKGRFDNEKEVGQAVSRVADSGRLAQHGLAQAMGRTGRKADNLVPGHGA